MIKIKLKDLAGKLNKTISDVARETGINRNTITSLFHEKVDGVKFSTLERVCETYDVKIIDIIEYEKDIEIDKKEEIYKQEGELVLFTMWPAIEVFNNLDENFFDFGYGSIYAYSKEGYSAGYFVKGEMERLARYFYMNYSNKKEFNKIYETYLKDSKRLEEMYLAHNKEYIVSLSEFKLKEFLGILSDVYAKFWKTSLFIDSFDSGFDQEKIKEIADKYGFSSKEVGELTIPDEMTFNNERLLDLLKVVKKIKRKKIEGVESFLDNFIKTSADIADYRMRYDYYKSNYAHIEPITDEEIKEEITKYYKDDKLFKDTFDELSNYSKIQIKKKRNILKKYKLRENPLDFFAKLTYWREHRKKVNLMGINLMFFILESLEKMTGIPVEYLRNSNFEEVQSILSGLVNKDMLKKRNDEGFMFIVTEDEGFKMIVEGKEALSLKEEKEKILMDGKDEKIVSGSVASQGYAKGIAKIVLDKKSFDKFEEGDILITGMTRPEFVPLMKKAAGIVTNEGGITCHAAIVSRELGKPCIIGTQNATQIIKDGDLVEVRANHGTVRVLNG